MFGFASQAALCSHMYQFADVLGYLSNKGTCTSSCSVASHESSRGEATFPRMMLLHRSKFILANTEKEEQEGQQEEEEEEDAAEASEQQLVAAGVGKIPNGRDARSTKARHRSGRDFGQRTSLLESLPKHVIKESDDGE